MCITSSFKLVANLMACYLRSIAIIVPEENCGDKTLIVEDKMESEIHR